MADDTRSGHEARPEHRPQTERTDAGRTDADARPRKAYRKPTLASGERMEKTSLASCATGAQFCGPYALEA